MAFIRRKGNAYYLVHSVRRGGKVRQLHLARLGDRPQITPEVIRQVRRRHPLLELDWDRVRQQASRHVILWPADPEAVEKLKRQVHGLTRALADLAPAWLAFAAGEAHSRELASLLRLLHTTLDIKLRQFERLLAGRPAWPLTARRRLVP